MACTPRMARTCCWPVYMTPAGRSSRVSRSSPARNRVGSSKSSTRRASSLRLAFSPVQLVSTRTRIGRHLPGASNLIDPARGTSDRP